MWVLDHKEVWVLKNWCFWTVVLENTFGSPLDSREIKPVNPKGDQSWIFIGRTADEPEALILWSPDTKSRLIGKEPDAAKAWGQEKGAAEAEVVGWCHWLSGCQFEGTLGVSEAREACVASVRGVVKSQAWLRAERQHCLPQWLRTGHRARSPSVHAAPT